MVRLLAERYDTKSNVMLGGFRAQLQASYMSNHTQELGYNETVYLWMTIYILFKKLNTRSTWNCLSMITINKTKIQQSQCLYI